jgi:hypothetical protein
MAFLNKEKKIVLSNERTIVFNELTETKKSKDQDPADEPKPIRRGVWFFENAKKNLVPLPDSLVVEIEEAKQNEEKMKKLISEDQEVDGVKMKINLKESIVTVKQSEKDTVNFNLQRGLSGEDEIKDVIGTHKLLFFLPFALIFCNYI